jgi:hypothetical protein
MPSLLGIKGTFNLCLVGVTAGASGDFLAFVGCRWANRTAKAVPGWLFCVSPMVPHYLRICMLGSVIERQSSTYLVARPATMPDVYGPAKARHRHHNGPFTVSPFAFVLDSCM